MLMTTTGPFQDSSANLIYQLLFCDNAELYRPTTTKPFSYPFDVLFADRRSAGELESLTSDPEVDPRVKVLACNELNKAGYKISNKELLGVIVEVGLDDGLDVLASFVNGTARYINHSGKVLIWESTTDANANRLTDALFESGKNVITRIGPWDQPRKAHPRKGNVRLTFLVSDGLYFGEGPIDALFGDPLAGPALNAATALMIYLTEMTSGENKMKATSGAGIS
jgi:hypothetical protein